MRHIRILSLVTLGGVCFFAAESGSFGQRFGGRGAAAVSARTGAASGPFGGAGVAARTSQSVIGPLGGAATAGAGRGSFTTGNGTTIDYAAAGRAATGPGGVTAGRGVGGVQVTAPGGQTFTKVGAAHGAVGPNGNAVGGKGSIAVGQGLNGSAVSANRGGIAIGPNGVVAGGSKIGAAAGPGGTAVGASRGVVSAGPYGLSGYAARGVATGHRTAYVAAGTLRGQGVYVRKNFVNYDSFHPNWYVAHPNAWRAAAWTAAAFWRGAAWATLSSTCGYPPQPVIYDYGTTVVYEDNRVYYNGEPVATAEEYTQQAAAIADQGEQAKVSEKEEWMPLGVFGMVKGEDTEANQIFQLAVNKDGVLRGNYYDALSDTTLPVYGAVDKRTQRAAWTVGDRKDTVYETGVGNLTEPETTMLVHFGKDRTQQWTLIRLEEPQQN